MIERAIAKASGADGENFEEIRYEGYGPDGVAIIVETMTDNRNRTASSVRSILGKAGGSLAETGAVAFLFERKGLVLYPGGTGSADDMLEAAVEAGAEDVESSEESHEIYCNSRDLNDVSQSLETAFGESESSKLIWKPVTTMPLDLEGAQKIMRLVDALEEDDDVQTVTTNIEIPDDIMDKLAV